MSISPRKCLQVWARDAGICGICQEPVDAAEAELDHIVQRHAGGDDSVENLRVVHIDCNRRRPRGWWPGPLPWPAVYPKHVARKRKYDLTNPDDVARYRAMLRTTAARRRLEPRACRECGQTFEGWGLKAFCSPRCAQRWHYYARRGQRQQETE